MKKYLFPVLTLFTLVTGCSATSEEHSSSEKKNQTVPLLTYEKGSDDWSVITSNTDSPKILEAYQFAVEHPEVLNYMPCYCGCYEEDGHTSNTNCFVDHVEGTTVTLDTMGFG